MSTITSADGTVIDYDSYGRGPTVVFIGGAAEYRTTDQTTAQAATKLASEGFTTIDYDRRGRGRSGDTPPWTLEKEVQDLAALIEAAGGPATLYTSSSGATVALAAADAGLPVSALALYEPPFFKGADHTEHLAQLHALLAAGRHDEAMRYNLTSVVRLPIKTVEEMAHQPWWPGLVAVAPTLVYDLSSVHQVNVDPDWRARWSSLTADTIVYSGELTFPGLAAAADAVAQAVPDARRRILPGQSHRPAPDVIVPALLNFLRT
jgi:pimeloyl-ACP methyl ester carboxylesterase